LYAQDKTELLVASGVFSLTNNKWIKRPTKSIPPKPNTQAIKAKVEGLTDQISDAIQQGNELSMLAIVQRLSDMRKSGLQTKGEFSVENLAFKTLRNSGAIARLRAAIEDSTDKKLTLESTESKLTSKLRVHDPGRVYRVDLTPSAVGRNRFGQIIKDHPRRWRAEIRHSDTGEIVRHAGIHKSRKDAVDELATITESVSHHGPKAKAYHPKKKKYVSKHHGPSSKAGGLSSVDRWRKRRVAKIWAWKRSKGARLSREKPGSEKSISHRTYMAARNLTYKAILGKNKKSKMAYGARGRVEKTAKRVYRLNIRNPENRVRYKYRRKDTTKRSGVSYNTP
jgi:hypothetical protein